jgi:hypothetical protein
MPWQRIEYRRASPAWIVYGRLGLAVLAVTGFVATVWHVSK